jgi:flagellar motor switch protein FliG
LGFDVPLSTSPQLPTAKTCEAVSSDATRIKRRVRAFAELGQLRNKDLTTVLQRADPEVLVLALAGADASFVERAMGCLPASQARLLRRALKHLGPTRLSDVQEAQQSLADLAEDLHSQYTPNAQYSPRLAMAG